jgi:glycosyltransferase involved in cell wall biosynthesis
MAAHKGYFLFKEAVEKAQLSNCEVIVISHAQVAGSVTYDTWGNTSVKFISKVPQTKIYEFYSTIDVLLAPSMWPESFGLVTREAAAAGVWVVASNKGALAEDLIPGVNGDVFNPDNIEELIGVLQKIESEPELYQQLVNQNVPIRTTQKQVEELLNIYQTFVIQSRLEPI